MHGRGGCSTGATATRHPWMGRVSSDALLRHSACASGSGGFNRGGRGVVSPVDRLVGAGSFPSGLGRDSPQPISAKRGATDSPKRLPSRPLPARVDPPTSVVDRLLPQRSERS